MLSLLRTRSCLSSSRALNCSQVRSQRHLSSFSSGARFSRQSPATPRPLLGRYDHVPVELARVQTGTEVRLRDYESQKERGRSSYDLKLKDGHVLPAEGDNFTGSNGFMLREPLSPRFQEVVQNFRGTAVAVYVLKKGTPLPENLTILHEQSDRYSLQCSKPMTLQELNDELTTFINEQGRTLNKKQFDEEYPSEKQTKDVSNPWS